MYSSFSFNYCACPLAFDIVKSNVSLVFLHVVQMTRAVHTAVDWVTGLQSALSWKLSSNKQLARLEERTILLNQLLIGSTPGNSLFRLFLSSLSFFFICL